MKAISRMVLVALAVVLAGPLSAQSGKAVTLRMAWWGGDARHKATLAALDEYHKVNSNVTIQGEYGGFDGYNQKIKLQLAAGTAPDIIQLDQPWLTELQKKGKFFVDLSKESGFDLAGFDPTFLKNYCEVDGKIVAVPTGLGGYTFLVNKDAAAKAGVKLDKLADWDGFLAEGKRLHAANKNFYLFGHDSTSSFNFAQAYLKELTGRPIILDDYTLGFKKDDAVKVFEWMGEAVAGGVMQNPGENMLYASKRDQDPKWISQNIAVAIDYASNLASYKAALPKDTAFDTLPLPTVKGAKTGSTVVRPSQIFVVNAKSPNLAEAVKVLNWLMNNKDAAFILADVRGVPATKSARDVAKAANKIDALTLDAIDNAVKNQALADTALTHNSQIDEIFRDVTIKAEFGAVKPEAAADELISRLTTKLASIKASAQ